MRYRHVCANSNEWIVVHRNRPSQDNDSVFSLFSLIGIGFGALFILYILAQIPIWVYAIIVSLLVIRSVK